MSMLPRDPFDAVTPLRDAITRLFEDSVVWPRFEFFTGRTFPVDIYETEDKQKYVIEATLPGFKPEELEITAAGDTLIIHALKKSEEKVEKGTFVRRERYEGEMTRTFTLPTTIEPEKVETSFEHGILKLYIPKVEEARPMQIPIKVKQPVGV